MHCDCGIVDCEKGWKPGDKASRISGKGNETRINVTIVKVVPGGCHVRYKSGVVRFAPSDKLSDPLPY